MSAVILVIEDNPLNLRLVRRLVTRFGYHMLEAVDGESGIALAQAEQPDLILVDVNLPDIDGLEVTRRIKADANLAHIPVIALTANAMHGDRERCLDAGCDGYVPKPISRTELHNTLRRFLTVAGLEATNECVQWLSRPA